MGLKFCKKCGHIGTQALDVAWCPHCFVGDNLMVLNETNVPNYAQFELMPKEEQYKYMLKLGYYIDPDEHKRYLAHMKQKEQWNAEYKAYQARLAKQAANKVVVTCPYCKSTDTKKISGASRWLSTGLFGLGSGKAGKQWHCRKCNSDF